jgi:hypothetical protein
MNRKASLSRRPEFSSMDLWIFGWPGGQDADNCSLSTLGSLIKSSDMLTL